MTTLHLICGLPGAGKSTLARRLEIEEAIVRFTPDDWLLDLGFSLHNADARERVEQLQWRVAQDVLRLGQSVSLENGFWIREERLRYREAAKQMGVLFRLHYLDVPLGELRRRVAHRNLSVPEQAKIDLDYIDDFFADFEAPTTDEFAFD